VRKIYFEAILKNYIVKLYIDKVKLRNNAVKKTI